MNKTLTPTEVKDLLATTKIPVPAPTMSRHDRMMIWAKAVARYTYQLEMFHGIEFQPISSMSELRVRGMSIFDLGHREPALAKQGLSSNSIGENVNFFELSRDELHYLSCDCHGQVSNSMVAHRIGILATMKAGEYHEPAVPMPVLTTAMGYVRVG